MRVVPCRVCGLSLELPDAVAADVDEFAAIANKLLERQRSRPLEDGELAEHAHCRGQKPQPRQAPPGPLFGSRDQHTREPGEDDE